MALPIPIALPATANQRLAVAGATLVHITPLARLGDIVQRQGGAPSGEWAEAARSLPATRGLARICTIRLLAGHGYSRGRWLRDYSVIDLPFGIGGGEDFARYMYFFRSTPGRWAAIKNIGRSWSSILETEAVIMIRGLDLLVGENSGPVPLFLRGDDDAVVVRRASYEGEALVWPVISG
ncbi:hypothetical protein [Elioraea rosea]|uniref:hypothetical protein n=1 Tax=Elioraea rosea TaxID=2492390 RepID=UPI0011840712|nr:hypothetical protein [Elioraea rosea]